MANTKVTGDLIASGTITAANLVSGTLDTLLNGYLTTNAYATESYVTTAVSNLIDAAPASLDTLNELAAALNDDANFATTVTDSIATKLPLAGGNITGNLSVDTNVLFVDTVNDSVGIGTSTPLSLSGSNLSIVSSGNVRLQLDSTTDFRLVSNTTGNFIIQDATNSSDKLTINADGSVFFRNNSSETMRIDASGNVGIGTSNPLSTLHLQNAAGTKIILNGNGGDGSPGIYMTEGTSSPFELGGHFWYDGATNSIKLDTGSTTLVNRITVLRDTGEVGIGTSSPGHELDVVKSTSLDNVLRVKHTNGIYACQILMEAADDNGGRYNGIRSLTAGGTEHWSVSGSSVINTMVLKTAGSERMRISSSGNVSIGGTNTDKKFVIEDANYSARFYGDGFNFVMGDPVSGINRVIYFRNSGSGGLTVSVQGTLIKSSGSFKIDHPLKEDTHHLVHSFVESPQANNIYRGKVQLVQGKATVNLDEVSTMTEGTFAALNRDIHTYTSNESDWDAVRGSVQGNILTIECQNAQSTATVSWLVIGERQDKHMYDTDWTDENGKVIVEPEK